MFGGGFGKQIAADIVSQIQQLRADLMTEFQRGRIQEHGNYAQSEAAHIDAHRYSLSPVTIPIFHLIVDCFNILGAVPRQDLEQLIFGILCVFM